MHVVTVEFVVKPECVAAFRQAVMEQAANTLREEPACRRFDVCIDLTGGNTVFLYEIYDDHTAFEEHLRSRHFQEFDSTTRAWLEQKTVQSWRLLEEGP